VNCSLLDLVTLGQSSTLGNDTPVRIHYSTLNEDSTLLQYTHRRISRGYFRLDVCIHGCFARSRDIFLLDILHWYTRCHFVNVLVPANGTDNTPANDSWYLSIGYTFDNDTVEWITDVALLPDCTVDTIWTSQSDLAQANILLAPLTLFAQSQTGSAIDI
jgi:hypothetical protein